MSIRHFQAGDTIIEALLAITIFSLVAVGSLTLMNKGTATAQRALEITAVRHQIDNQAEFLRYVHNTYLSNPSAGSEDAEIWSEIKTSLVNDNDIGAINISSGSCPAITTHQKPFVLSDSSSNRLDLIKLTEGADNFGADPASFAQLRPATVAGGSPTSDGLWIEARKNSGYIDFYIRSCWQTIGQKVPMTIQTIVRLYDKS